MKTGLVRWEWHSLDHVAASESETPAPKKPTPWDWFHINSIDVQPDGNVFISARSTWAGYQLEGGSGNILWRLGGLKSSFKMGPGTETAWQHDGRILSRRRSHLLRRRLEPADPPAVAWPADRARLQDPRSAPDSGYTHPDPPLLAPSQGNMQTLADGNAVVGYGGVPAISEFAPGGTLLFDAHLPYDMSFYRAFRFPWSGRPCKPADGAGQPEQHRRRDDRAHELERRQRSGLLARACGREAPDRSRPGPRSRRATSKARRSCPRSTPTRQSRRSNAAGSVLGSSKPAKVSTYAAALPSAAQQVGMSSDCSSKPVLWSACAEPCPWCSSCRSSAWRSSCSLFYRRTLPPPAWPQGRPAALAWRPVTFVSSAGLLSSLTDFGAHPTRRWQLLARARRACAIRECRPPSTLSRGAGLFAAELQPSDRLT